MLSLRFPRLWLGLGWFTVAMAVVVCLVPMDELPQPPNMSDKSEHFVAYFILSVLFAGVYQRNRYWIIAAGLVVMGILIEFAQGAMGLGRQADFRDVLANSSGIAVGLVLCWFGLGSKPQVGKS
jgi:VanZ family protein